MPTQLTNRHLRRIAAARQRQDAAHRALLDALSDGIAAGVPQPLLSEAAGISRVTLWRWLTSRGPTDGHTDVDTHRHHAVGRPTPQRSPRAAVTAEGMSTSEMPDAAASA